MINPTPSKTRIFKPRINKLKAKLTGGAITSTDTGFAKEALEAAEREMAEAAANFAACSQQNMADLAALVTRAQQVHGLARKEIIDKINMLAHELRGQGGTFGYPLLTTFAGSLFKFTCGKSADMDDDRVAIVKAHADVIRAVLGKDIRGDGGHIGRELVRALQKAIKK
jgi:chemotaxis protein histidine kinase CheA